MIRILSISIISLLFASGASAFQFEDAKWGGGFDSVYNTLAAGKHDVEQGEYYIKYRDVIFGKNCYVKFFFTPQTKLLAKISIEWNEDSIGVEIRKALVKKYGSPNTSDDTAKRFIWEEGQSEEDERMVLNYGFTLPVVLNYYGGTYWRRFQEEGKSLLDLIPFL